MQKQKCSFLSPLRGKRRVSDKKGGYKGFTLIELLVVVLIIGILTAVAVPQYQKATQRSRNAELKQLIKTVAQAEKVYYLANGKYAANFNELDLDLPLSAPGSVGNETNYANNEPCELATVGPDAIRRGKDFDIILNTTDLNHMYIVGIWTNGPYQCAGFYISLNDKSNLLCWEERNGRYTKPNGAFCEKIENGTELPEL